jgi:hypothetical protein
MPHSTWSPAARDGLVFVSWAVLLAAVLLAPVLTESPTVGDDLTRYTIRLSLAYYGIAAALMLRLQPGEWTAQTSRGRLARWCWTLAWLTYLVHLGMALHHYDHWSHAEAIARTHRATGFGPGIYVSHLFTLAWTADVAWWWLVPASWSRRPGWIDRLLHAFMVLIIFCATVVYEEGFIRWAGLALLLALGLLWLTRPHDESLQAGSGG